MSEQTSQEPTMEEILASIRRIISEDDAPAAEDAAAPEAIDESVADEVAAAAPVEAATEAHEEPAASEASVGVERSDDAVDDDDALELTEKVETVGDLDVFSNEEAPPPAALLGPAPEQVAAPASQATEAAEPAPAAPAAATATLVSDRAANAAAAAFGALSATLAMPRSERTLEDVVRELLRPLLQQWLDDNLPGIVQTAVEAEVARIARSGGR